MKSKQQIYDEDLLIDIEDIKAKARFLRSKYQQCPICKVRNSIITNAHCKIEHNMSKKEVEEKYGKILTGLQIYKNMTPAERELYNKL